MRWFHYVILVVLLLSGSAMSSELQGRVVSIADGDTFTLLTADKQQIRIRLAEIDTPESGQPYGNRAKQALSQLVFGKDVRVEIQDIDRYGRTVGRWDDLTSGVSMYVPNWLKTGSPGLTDDT